MRNVIKGLAVLLLAAGVAGAAFGQTERQKFALVIGNGNYTGLSRLANPVNDANDVAASLQKLGFTVDKLLNGSQEQMDSAVMRLKNRLSVSGDAYGFFFYAGHGVQSAGENYLIPVDANIPSENALRSRAVSVQMILDDLNDARNSLNVIVLDACRDNPFGWARSGTRGLSIVSRQPADSIIVYATSAGQRASDGEGRNGLFTSQLLRNLDDQSLEVVDVFRNTGADVAEVSGNTQIPAIYSQVFKRVWLGTQPEPGAIASAAPRPSPQPLPAAPERAQRPPRERPPVDVSPRLWSVGASVGTSFVEPWVVGTLSGTIAPFDNVFIEPGVDIGFVSGESDVGYYSFCPFLHAGYYRPLSGAIGVYAGAGGSFMTASYSFPGGDLSESSFGADAFAGLRLFDMVNISFTVRTNFSAMISKVSAGYTHRF